jgi:hypothetical protein
MRHMASSDQPRTDELLFERLAAAGVLVAAVSIVLTFVIGLIEGTVLPYDRLNPDFEGSFFNWASAGAELIAAFVCAVHAVVSPKRRGMFIALTLLLLYTSLDDSFVVHETMAQALEDHVSLVGTIGAQFWIVVYAPLLVAIAYFLLRAVQDELPSARRLVLAGLACFGIAIGLEVLGATPLGEPLAAVVAEEALELGGWELVAAALTIVLAATLVRFDRDGASTMESGSAR